MSGGLIQYIKQQDATGVIDIIVSKGTEIINTEKDELNRTPLMLTATVQNFFILQFLLSAGASVNMKNPLGRTALMFACEGSQLDIVKELLLFRANINEQDNEGVSALMTASKNPTGILILQELLAQGANVHLKDVNGATALMYAISSASLSASLSASNTNTNTNANVNGNVNANTNAVLAVLALLSKGVGVHERTLLQKNTPLMHASALGHSKLVQQLLLHGAKVDAQNENGDTALHMVCSSSSSIVPDAQAIETIRFLIANGASTDLKNAAGKLPINVCRSESLKAALNTAISDESQRLLFNYTNTAAILEHSQRLKAEEDKLKLDFVEKLKVLQAHQDKSYSEATYLEAITKKIIEVQQQKLDAEQDLASCRKSFAEIIKNQQQVIQRFHEELTALKDQVSQLKEENETLKRENAIVQLTASIEGRGNNNNNRSNSTNNNSNSNSNSNSNNNNNNSKTNNTTGDNKNGIVDIHSAAIIPFSYETVRTATNSFSSSLKMGDGKFGSVYKGSLSGLQVAVRRLNKETVQNNQFRSELATLSKFRHPNIIGILGVFEDPSKADVCLVYEFANGSLRDRLDRKNGTSPLNWQQREGIAMGIASGMNYLQNADSKLPFFHLALKSSNILLDGNYQPKIADFGLATAASMTNGSSNYYIRAPVNSTDTSNTCPEYLFLGKVSRKTDVYSYGCILTELLTSQPVSASNCEKLRNEFAKNQNINSKIDKTIFAVQTPAQQSTLNVFTHVCIDCIQTSRLSRPSFSLIVEALTNKRYASVDNFEVERDRECCICSDKPTTAKFNPCNHACVCVDCAKTLIANGYSCVVCRTAISSFDTGDYSTTFVN